MPFATINGIKTYYRVHTPTTDGEAGARPIPLIFIHGGFGGMMTSVAAREFEWHTPLTDAYTIVHHDRRSAGQSEYPDTFYTLDDLASDVRELMRHEDIERAFIMGDSAGGPIAQTFALNYPDAVHALILAETGPALGRRSLIFNDTLLDRIRILREEGPEAAYADRKRAGDAGLSARPFQPEFPPEIAKAIAPQIQQTMEHMQLVMQKVKETTQAQRIQWHAGELRNYAAYADVDLTPRLKNITAPTVVIHGTNDRLVPFAFGQTLAEHIPGAVLRDIPDADHGVMIFPGAVEALREFLDEHAG